jgi:bifunctional non-homologous end joining protein LigD
MARETTGEKVGVEVGGRHLQLSNLHKVLYPEPGLTKGEVIDYYARVAPVMLPHLAGRPVTFSRWPDGVQGKAFYEKNAPRHTPDWVRTVTLPSPGSGMSRDTIDYVVIDDLPTLVWAANLAALELHVPQWKVSADGQPLGADLLVFDLDPGAPATVVECAEVALLLRDRLAADGLTAHAKTSGSKGMQLMAAIEPGPVAGDGATSGYAKRLAVELEKASPALVVSRMAKDARHGKVFIDWSQNSSAKTTVAPYSLRARPRATVSTPVTWDEVAEMDGGGADATGTGLSFTADDVLARVGRSGDLMAPLVSGPRAELPPA